MKYNNAEIRRGGQVVRANVEVDAFVPVSGPSAGQVQWSGVLRPPNNTGMELGETYTLVIPGFVPARILVTEEANPVDASVAFRGVGQLPAAVPSRHVQESR